MNKAVKILGVFEDYMMGEFSVDEATDYIKEQRESLRDLPVEAEPVADPFPYTQTFNAIAAMEKSK